jgi:hypothetical protein
MGECIWENDLRNLQYLCAFCNSSKGAKTWEEWGKAEWQASPLSVKWER